MTAVLTTATVTRVAPAARADGRRFSVPVVVVTALAPVAWGTTYVVTTELLPPGRPLLARVLRSISGSRPSSSAGPE